MEKSTRVKSTKPGLANIEAKYRLLSDKQPVIDLSDNRLALALKPPFDKESIVSREKTNDFKKWMWK